MRTTWLYALLATTTETIVSHGPSAVLSALRVVRQARTPPSTLLMGQAQREGPPGLATG